MAIRPGPALLLFVSAAACSPPPEAPTEWNELTRYLYREFDNEDPRVLEAGVVNAEDLLLSLDAQPERDVDERAFVLEDLSLDDVAAIERPDRPIENCVNIAVARASAHGVDDFAWMQIQSDQTPVEPTAESYVREVVEPEDPQCFSEGTCGVIRTRNDIRRVNFLMSVNLVLWKDVRRIAVIRDGEDTGRQALLARSWVAESFEGDNGNTAILQSYTPDLWIDQGDGTSLRYQGLYQESDVGGEVSDDIVLATLKNSIDDALAAGDEGITELRGR